MALTKIDFQYRREHGVHRMEMLDGTEVAAVAVPSWGEFMDELTDVPECSGYIVSPEQITTTQMDGGIDTNRQEVGRRVAEVIEASRQHPNGMIMLGTETLNSEGKVRNSLAVVSDGTLRGYIDKGRVAGPEGSLRWHCAKEERDPVVMQSASHGAIISSDIIEAIRASTPSSRRDRYIDPNVDSLLISSCWAVPLVRGNKSLDEIDPEVRYKMPLEKYLQGAFSVFPSLNDIVLVDRVPERTGIAPLTVHVQRQE